MSDAPLTPAVFHVLLALSDGPAHGYGVMQRAEHSSGQTLGPGTVYGALGRLRDAGWVAEVAMEDSADARRGKSFDLTSQGKTALQAEARRITHLADRDEVRRLATSSGSQQ